MLNVEVPIDWDDIEEKFRGDCCTQSHSTEIEVRETKNKINRVEDKIDLSHSFIVLILPRFSFLNIAFTT
jgi:hypothetical protein